MMTPEDTMVFAQFAFVAVTSVGALAGIGVAVHAYIARSRRKHAIASPVDDDRMLRLEQAVDSIAVEVERISEGQRFLTKLQQDRALKS
ncbi:MAG: hypothetical protein JWL95_1805 [Gemmatimonadetes bacterium]|nr:hypothetical protein [Gemmatimonadota bacterium]